MSVASFHHCRIERNHSVEGPWNTSLCHRARPLSHQTCFCTLQHRWHPVGYGQCCPGCWGEALHLGRLGELSLGLHIQAKHWGHDRLQILMLRQSWGFSLLTLWTIVPSFTTEHRQGDMHILAGVVCSFSCITRRGFVCALRGVCFLKWLMPSIVPSFYRK